MGEGATGKTILCDLIFEHNNRNTQGITVNVTRGATIQNLTADLFHADVLKQHNKGNRIFILDEDEPFVSSNDFAVQVKESGCYFILINRDNLPQISCSTKEIYQLEHLDKRFITTRQMYPNTHYGKLVDLKYFLTEDTRSGKQFFSRVFTDAKVIGAGGRSRIKQKLLNSIQKNEYPIVIADGAAFGFNINEILPLVECTNCLLIIEESFEYVLLKSGIIHPNKLTTVNLDSPNVDSHYFTSWEKYYEDLICKLTAEDYHPYKKEDLHYEYTIPKHAKAILDVYRLPYPESIMSLQQDAYTVNITTTDIFTNK